MSWVSRPKYLGELTKNSGELSKNLGELTNLILGELFFGCDTINILFSKILLNIVTTNRIVIILKHLINLPFIH